MAIVAMDISIVPVGTASTGLSDIIAACELILKEYPGVAYRVNPMSTTLQGELTQLVEIAQKMHDVPFGHQVSRVITTLRIDDRRDRPSGAIDAGIEKVLTKSTLAP
jgi:uncharacterized protein (TIGR00106 family)